MDRAIIAALREKDTRGLTRWEESRFYWPGREGFGTGETKSWITVAGALHDTRLEIRSVEYFPIYRTVAGSGVGAALSSWLLESKK